MNAAVLAIDAGSTRTKCAVIKDDQVVGDTHWMTMFNFNADDLDHQLKQARQLLAIDQDGLEGVVIGNVVDAQNEVRTQFEQAFDGLPLLYVDRTQSARLKLGPLDFSHYPVEQLGVDRLCNGLAAYHHVNEQNSMIIDCGTYTTIELVSAEGQFKGGAVMPGPLMFESMWTQSQFYDPKHPADVFTKPEMSPGTDTIGSVQNGLYYGFKGMLFEVISQQMSSIRWSSTTTQLLVTGGYGESLRKLLQLEFPKATVKPHLTLEGLYFLYLANRPA
ncbi:MAG: type III pantothenate kinase [Cyanobacteria bacterium HKST-UBA06]|nr:type III pantothenate kinase [Cyanobacteria bacterium HKST-UBA04]MCA9807518.1 type III pantothenate kinase [Cyanobacteria bacterium HKST-UBA06]